MSVPLLSENVWMKYFWNETIVVSSFFTNFCIYYGVLMSCWFFRWIMKTSVSQTALIILFLVIGVSYLVGAKSTPGTNLKYKPPVSTNITQGTSKTISCMCTQVVFHSTVYFLPFISTFYRFWFLTLDDPCFHYLQIHRY